MTETGPSRLPLTAASYRVLRNVYQSELEVLRHTMRTSAAGHSSSAADRRAQHIARFVELERLLFSLDTVWAHLSRQRASAIPERVASLSDKDWRLLDLLGFDVRAQGRQEERSDGEGCRVPPGLTRTGGESACARPLVRLGGVQDVDASRIDHLVEENQLLRIRLAESQWASRHVHNGDLSQHELHAAPSPHESTERIASEDSATASPADYSAESAADYPLPFALSPAVSRVLRILQDPDRPLPDLSTLSREELLELKAATTVGLLPSSSQRNAAPSPLSA